MNRNCCKLCGGANLNLHEKIDEKYSFIKCTDCDATYVEKWESEEVFVDFSDLLSNVMQNTSTNQTNINNLTPSEAQAFRYIIDKDKKNIFEICFEAGRLLLALNDRKINIQGSDPIKGHVELLKQKEINVIQAILPDQIDERIDCVVILESLVRFNDPVAFISSVVNKFPNADVIITTPSPNRSLMSPGVDRKSDYPPHHIWRWSEKSLYSLGRKLSLNTKTKICHIDCASLDVPKFAKKIASLVFRVLGESEYSYMAVYRK